MLDQHEWPHLEAENQSELLAYLGTARCADSYAGANITWVITGVDSNDYNGVIWSRLTSADADHLVPELVEQFRRRGLPALWQLDPDSQPPDLGQRLQQLGCYRLRPGVCMAAALRALPQTVPSIPKLTIERVTTA